MNTRGIVQLVVLNIGVELKVLSPKIFAMFVFMAVVLTCLTSPILHFLYRRDSSNADQSNSYIPLDETTNSEDLVAVTTTTTELDPSQPLLDNHVHSRQKRRRSLF